MGLNIMVYRVMRSDEPENDDCEWFSLIEYPQLTRWAERATSRDVEFYCFAEQFVALGKNFDDWENVGATYGETTRFHWKHKMTGEKLTTPEPQTRTESQPHVRCVEVADQRKGANRQFYADGWWENGLLVIDAATLKDHHARYFSGDGNVAGEEAPRVEGTKAVFAGDEAPFGYGVEYGLSAKDNRERFQTTIVDRFVEGETFVIYA